MRISDWSSDVCSSDLRRPLLQERIVSKHPVKTRGIQLIGGVPPEVSIARQLVVKPWRELHFTSARGTVHAGEIFPVLKHLINRGIAMTADADDILAIPLQIVRESCRDREGR